MIPYRMLSDAQLEAELAEQQKRLTAQQKEYEILLKELGRAEDEMLSREDQKKLITVMVSPPL